MLTEEQIQPIMKERGYKQTAHFESGGQVTAYNFIKHVTDQLTIHAKVTLKSNSISLYFIDLQYFCQLLADNFAFDHNDFEKYEQIICMYAAKCLEIDVFAVLESLKKTIKPPTLTKEQEEEEIKRRRRILWDKIVLAAKEKKYPKELCLEFYNYWVEKNPKGKRMRFEMEKVFEIKRRIATWISHDRKWAKTFIDKKVESQNTELKKSTSVNKEDLF